MVDFTYVIIYFFVSLYVFIDNVPRSIIKFRSPFPETLVILCNYTIRAKMYYGVLRDIDKISKKVHVDVT